MGIYKNTVRVYGDEGAFLSQLYNTMLSAIGESRITSTSSLIPTVESIGSDTVTPYFEIVVDGVYKMRVERGSTVKKANVVISGETRTVIGGSSATYYTVAVTHIATGTTLSNLIAFTSGGSTKYWYAEIVREWKVALVTNSKCMVVQLGAYNELLVDYDAGMDVLLLIDSDISIFRAKKPSVTTGWIAGTGETIAPLTRQAVIYDADNSSHICMVRNKLFRNTSDNTMVLVSDGLYDITNLGGISNRRITIDNCVCYVLDENTLMPLS